MGAAAPLPASTTLLPANVIVERVAEHFGFSPEDIRSPRLSQSLGFARHVAVLLLSELTAMSGSEIAGAIRRCPGSGTHILQSAKGRLQDQRFSAAVEQIRERLLEGNHGH